MIIKNAPIGLRGFLLEVTPPPFKMLAAFCNLNTVCVCVTEFQIIDFICGNTFLKAVNDEGYKRKAAAKAVAVSCVGGRQVLIIN